MITLQKLKNIFSERFGAKVFLKFFTLVIAIALSLTISFIYSQRKSLTDNLIKEGRALAKILAYNSRLGVFSEHPDFLKDPVEGIMERDRVLAVSVFTVDGRLLIRSGRPEKEDREDHKKIIGVLTSSPELNYSEKPDQYSFWAPVLSGSPQTSEDLFFSGGEGAPPAKNVIGFVKIDLSKDSLNKNLRALLLKSLIITSVSLISLGLIIYLLTKNVMGPLRKLSDGVRTISEGNLHAEIPVSTRDQIGKLALAFNEMAKSLRERDDEKERLMEQLGRAQRLEAIGRVSAGIAHDFNNILTIIQSNLELARGKSPDYIQGYIGKSIEASSRGSDIVKHLLYFTHEKAVKSGSVNIALIAHETVKLLSGALDSAIKVNVGCAPDLPKVNGDAGQIQQVIMNLILNANDAIIERKGQTDKPFVIDINLESVKITEDCCKDTPQASLGDFVLLTVTDNGVGMDKQTIAHIFEPFFSTKQQTSKKGLGLGLSTVYGIMEAHNGWIDLKSGPGVGSVFYLYFPKFTGSELPPQENCHDVAGGTETILLVDDEEYILDAVKEKLEDLGYKVFTAKNGEDALGILRNKRRKFDLIVLDHVMPGLSGIEVLREIRRMNLKSKVLVYSGQDLSPYASTIEDFNFISKPHNLDELANKIRELLGYEWKYALKTSINRVKLHYIGEKTVPYEEQLTDTTTVVKLFRHIASEPRETFLALYLDSQKRIIAYDNLSLGTTDKAIVFPKEVVRAALLTNASSVILIHNHPSGELKPSQQDIVLTAAVQEACEVVDIKVFDHIIISEKGYYSFRDERLM